MFDGSSHHESQKLALLALSEMKGVGFETLKKVARDRISFTTFFQDDMGKSCADKIALTPSYSRIREQLLSENSKFEAVDLAHRRYEYFKQRRIEILFPDSSSFPSQLRDLNDSPCWLFVEGNPEVLSSTSVTAVGSRRATADGEWLAKYFGYCLQELGIVTVSGLADGIDQFVHTASLAANLPTIAVLGTGILSDYPKGSEALRQEIVRQGGAVVTEYLPKDTVSAKNFVRRNRIQAALGKVLFPIEWKAKSGTAHTVRFGNELNRSIIYARTPTQSDFSWIPREYRHQSECFTLPNEHDQFMRAIVRCLAEEPLQQALI